MKVILVDEGVFPFNFDSIRSYLREVTIRITIITTTTTTKGATQN
jgi:hypothetical protein